MQITIIKLIAINYHLNRITTNITSVFPNTPTKHTIEYRIANITFNILVTVLGSDPGHTTWVVLLNSSSIVINDDEDVDKNENTSTLLLLLL